MANAHASEVLLRTLHELARSALSLDGAVMGDPAGHIYPSLKHGVEEVSRLSGLALDQAKGLTATKAAVSCIAFLPICERMRESMHESNFI